MRPRFPLILILLAACGANDGPDHSIEWLRVLSHKKAATSQAATPREKQVYADSVAAFVETHPSHSRARQVYVHIQLDFANELSSLGRYRDSIRFYRAVLREDASNAAAQRGIQIAMEHLSVSRDKLLALQKGMSEREVISLLGKPIPGWSVRTERRDSTVESWYYRRNDGGVAAVYFRDGEVFAAEENSQAKLVPLVHTD
jgi:hypothetical protein